jgi:hypothetical protein
VSKVCTKCNEELPDESFYFIRGRREACCKSCKGKGVRASIKRHPEANRLRMEKWRNANPKKRLLTAARARAKKAGLLFNIGPEDIELPKVCPILGIDISYENNKRGCVNNAPSIDRFDNTKGYEKGNVAVVSWRANNLKRDATLEELELIIKWCAKR